MADEPKPAPKPAPLIELDDVEEAKALSPAALSVFKQLHSEPLSRERWLQLLNQFTGRI